jgi:hypothetical protein
MNILAVIIVEEKKKSTKKTKMLEEKMNMHLHLADIIHKHKMKVETYKLTIFIWLMHGESMHDMIL